MRLAGGVLAAVALSACAALAEPMQEYVFVIDTSMSMEEQRLVGPLRVALDDFADKIPVDGSSRVWIFTFDRGLGANSLARVLRTTKDLEETKIFLSSLKYAGQSTFIYKALNDVLDRIGKDTSDGQAHDIVLHLFTDGANNGLVPPSFSDNVKRYEVLKKRPEVSLTFYYHGLGIRPDDATSRLIASTEGMHFVDGITMPPKARFASSEAAPTDTTPVTFVSKTIGVVEKWEWDFGDGSTAKEESPTHVFRVPGTYLVTLAAVNKAGTGKAQQKVVVVGGAPKAGFVLREPGKPAYVGEPVVFLDQTVGRVTNSLWAFGDGKSVRTTAKSVTNVFGTAGAYAVRLHAEGPFGRDDFESFVKVVQRERVDFSSFPDSPEPGQVVKFSNESVGEYRTWSWSFGDGAVSAERNPSHPFSGVGSYSVALEGETLDGAKKRAVHAVKVTLHQLPPRAHFSLPVDTVDIGQPVAFQDASAGTIKTWQWDFGDGTKENAQNARHAYLTGGTFTVRLNVSGPLGESTCAATVTVRRAGLSIQYAPEAPRSRNPVTFDARTEGRFTGLSWNFGDGSAESSGVARASHVYAKPGRYTVKLSGTGPDARIWKAEQQVEVVPESVYVKPVIAFELAAGVPKVARESLTVKLVNRSTGSIRGYKWDFGDGATTDDAAPSHTYKTPGTNTIRLSVVDQLGNTFESTASQAITVVVLKPRIWPVWKVNVAAFALYVILAAVIARIPVRLRVRCSVNGIPDNRRGTGSLKYIKSAGKCTDDFEVWARRDLFLRKRYFFRSLKSGVKATRANGNPLTDNRLVANARATTAEGVQVDFKRFDDTWGPALVLHALIAAIAAGACAAGHIFLN